MATDSIVSLSIAGQNCYLLGNKAQYWRRPESFKESINEAESQLYIVFGTNSSWYRCSKKKDGKAYVVTSANFKTEYPSLLEILEKKKDYAKPKQLALGPNGRFFANIDSGRYRQSPKSMEETLGKVADYRRVWFGQGKSYVAVKTDGSCVFDLDGKYAGLEDKLNQNGGPSVLALNIEGDVEYIAVWPGGKASWRTKESSFKKEHIATFLQKHGFVSPASAK